MFRGNGDNAKANAPSSSHRRNHGFRRPPLVLITNRWDLSAGEISAMYRSRWVIEIFFKWLKQHVRIT
ncbi:transposase [Brevibacillus choshinensis]|uniref:transposase n=1 Tax=Brevibacillus choshinensis TaxID=54911 RepID=UPI0009FA3201